METFLPEVHPPNDSLPNLSGPVYAQSLGEDEVDEDKVSLGVPTHVENTLSFHGQYCREPASYFSRGRSIPSDQLRGHPVPTTPPNRVV